MDVLQVFLCYNNGVIYEVLMRIRKETDIMEQEEIALIAKCSDALGHPARVKIFRFIYTENMHRRTVCNKDVVEATGYAQATVSQHLSKLTYSGLVETQKKETYSYYYVNIGTLGKYLNAVKKLNQ